MNKNKKIKRKAQVGLDNIPVLNPNATNASGQYNWITSGDGNIPTNPEEIDPISQMQINEYDDPVKGKKAKVQPFRYDANGNMIISSEEGTGNYQLSPEIQTLNYAATGVTGIANLIQDNRLKKREQMQVLESLQQPYWENMEGSGLNNIPAYTKAGGKVGKYVIIKRPYGGGPLTSEGAKEILRDGKIRGTKLTPKQKRYFGYVAGGGDPKQMGGYGDCDDCHDEMRAGGNWIPKDLKKGRCANPGDKDCPKGSPQYNLAMTFKKHHGFHKKQTGGTSSATSSNPATNRRLTPQEMQQWNMFLNYVKEQGYEGSPDLNQRNKNLGSTLFSQFKKVNPNITIGYDIVPSVQQEMQLLKENVQGFAKRRNDPNADNLMTGISPVDGWFGSKTSQFRFPEMTTQVYNNGQLVSATNNGLLTGNMTPTGLPNVNAQGKSISILPTDSVNRKKTPPPGVKIEKVADSTGRVYDAYEDPQTGDIVELQAGGMPMDESLYTGGPVEAEGGEIIEGGNGQIFKLSDESNSHEEGGVKMDNVSRVLEDTSDQRKDRASKMLRISPEEMEALFGFKSKSSVSHAKAFELAKEHYDKERNKANSKNKVIAKKPNIDKLAAKSAELNFINIADIPKDEDVYDALFMHQQEVKRINGIKDDGTMAKYGYTSMKMKKAQTGTESDGFSRPARGRSNDYYFDEGTQRWYKNGTVPSAAAKQQVQQQQSATQATTQPQINQTGVQPYQGGRTVAGRTTPMGNSNAFGFIGGLDAYKSAWSPVMDLSKYNTVQDAQQATYNYIVQNAPAEAQKIWQNQGLTQKGRDMMNPKSKSYDPAFAQTAAQVFTPDGKLKNPNIPLTNEQLAALTPAYSDNMLGIRSLTPAQMETTMTDPGQQVTIPQSRQPLDSSVTINPNFIQQPTNRFNESIYWDELAAPLAGLIEQRDPELYNPVQFNQLRYKMLDPTAALNANQADYNAAVATLENMDTGTGAEVANLANLQANKYNANAQVMSQYDNQNTQIKNNEITYNTGVRDKQSVADAQTRGTYHRNVQQARENQRQQRLKSIEDISRVIQMKRRQNRSGNLILKLSPAFNQEGDYNGYQYAPILPTDLGISAQMPVVTSKGKTTTTKTTKIGNTVIRNTSSTK